MAPLRVLDLFARPRRCRELELRRHCYRCYQIGVAQLIVRSIEEKVVSELKQRAARHGVSMEEEHRRILREALSPRGRRLRGSFKDHLAKMPDAGDDTLFDRPPARVRRVRL